MANVKSSNPSERDIVVVPPVNGGGHDKIIGDLHGSLGCFIRVLESLEHIDRLFLVGDLVDRGEDSPGIIQTILNFQAKNPGRLFSVRGNHESLCLNAIIALEALTPALPILPAEYLSGSQSNFSDWINLATKFPIQTYEVSNPEIFLTEIYNHVMNGGDWLVSLFSHELEQGTIKKSADGLIEYGQASQVNMVKGFILQLPYILHVHGKRSFNVVHADMPFNDVELLRKITQGEVGLTDTEKDYATWVRERKPHGSATKHAIKDTGRDSKSNLTYVGHSIIAYGDAPVIRYQTNTVDLDVATYLNNISLVADHTGGRCQFIGINPDKVKGNVYLQEAQQELDTFLQAQLQK